MPQPCSLCWLPLSSAFAIIFHFLQFLFSLADCICANINRGKGYLAQLFLREQCDPSHLLLTLHLLNFLLLFHLLGPGTITLFLKFFRLSTCLAIHLYPSLFLLSVFLLVLKSSSPETPKTPSSPWELEWTLSQLMRLFPTSHKRTGIQPPKELFGEPCCSRFIQSEKDFHSAQTHNPRWQLLSSAEPIFNVHSKKCWVMKEDRKLHICQWRCLWGKGWYPSSE